MKKEDLLKLGVEEELAKQIMTMHGADITKAKSETTGKDETINDLKKQLEDRDKDLKKLQKDNSDNDALKDQIKTLQENYKDLEKTSAEKLVAIQRDSALTNLLTESKVKNPKAVAALLDNDTIIFKDGQLSGAKEQIEALQKSDAYLFDLGKKQGGYNPPSGSAATSYASFEEAMEKGDVDGFLKQQIESEENE